MVDCNKCVRRGRVNGLSQESYCSGCIHGDKLKKDYYVENQPVGEDVDATTIDNCGNCRKCYKGMEIAPSMFALDRMLVCPECGNKRCPKASDHRLACTNSNEPNQLGSVY